MAIQSATVLYPVNTTTVDTGAGIDVRFLDSATGSSDATQTANFAHTNDNTERTFDPATGGVTNTNNANTTLFKLGWALRLANDMTPADDTLCDAFISAGTLTVGLVMSANQTGGTYASGTFTPTFRASLWRYNPATDTGTLIASGTSNSTSWNATPATGDLGTAKNISISIVVPATVFGASKGTAAEVLYLQVGFNTGTVPDPTLGTGAWVMTFTVGTANTNITMAAGQSLAQVCYMVGTGVGSGVASASGVPVYPTTGTANGSGVATGALLAYKLVTGTALGSATVAGAFGAVKLGTGTSNGIATVNGNPAIVKPTVGTILVSAGGGTTIIIKKIFNILDD